MPESPLHKLRERLTPDPVQPDEVAYAELDVTTNFSFLRGASHPDECVNAAARLGYRAVAITDRNTLAGIVRAHVAARDAKLKLIVGARVTLSEGIELLVWCKDRTGYANLCRLLTLGKSRVGKGEFQLSLREFLDHSDGLIVAIDDWPQRRPDAEQCGEGSTNLHESARMNPDDVCHAEVLRSISSPDADASAYLRDHNTIPWHGFSTRVLQSETRVENPCHRIDSHALSMTTHEGTSASIRDDSCRFVDQIFSAPPRLCGQSELDQLKSALGNRLSLTISQTFGIDNESHLSHRKQLAEQLGVPLVAVNNVHYHDPSRRPLQDVLVCVREKTTIDQAGYKLFANAERHLKTPAQMHRLFAACPEAIARANQIAADCTFSLDELKYEYPHELVPEGYTTLEYLNQITWDGAQARYPGGVPDKVREAIDRELKLITQLHYEAYFLTVYDVVKFARSRDILCQGRGSAANSVVCYCIGVTSVDPVQIDLLFERFISAARNEPPDIDVDFEHERREEVIQYIYGKYGRDRAGMCAEIISYRGRSSIRDVGKALGLSLDMVDQMSRKLSWWDRGVLTKKQVLEAGLDPDDANVQRILLIAKELLGFPRHLGQHVGGMVMTHTPLCEMVPIENAAMPDRTVIEWDKDDIDAAGLLKVDCLALGMLTCISKAFKMMEEWDWPQRRRDAEQCGKGSTNLHESARMNPDGVCHAEVRRSISSPHVDASAYLSMTHNQGTPHSIREDSCRFVDQVFSAPLRLCGQSKRFELHTIPREDPLTYDMICDADTIGVFQIESRAQMSMLPRLRPRIFYDLVIEVAIVRPGPIQGNMVHPYLRRRSGEEPVSFPSKALEGVLGKTLGVPLFQEQAMKIAMVGAGFSGEEADQLRRAMAAWRRSSRLLEFRDKIVSGMLKNGYTQQFAEQCFEQIKGFGEYGFPESHSASFALLVYASAWLKRHHPAAFCAALLNSQPMGFYAPAQIVRDAREHAVEVLPADVNESEWDCTLVGATHASPGLADRVTGDACVAPTKYGLGGPAVRLGLRMLKGLNRENADRVVAARKHGRFDSVDDLHRRSGVSRSVIQLLAEADAFGSIDRKRRIALWEGLELTDQQMPLFSERMDWPQRRRDAEKSLSTNLHESTRMDSDDACHAEVLRSISSPPVDASEYLSMTEVQISPHSIRADSCGFVDPVSASHPDLPEMPLGQEVMTDYATAGLSLKAHPVSLIRETLSKQKIITSAQLQETARGKWVHVAGLVLIRQRPGTASGIVFVTLEDETGIVNLIVRPDIFERYQPIARHAALMQADGYVERQGQVIHIMAKRLHDRSDLIRGYEFTSRDFH